MIGESPEEALPRRKVFHARFGSLCTDLDFSVLLASFALIMGWIVNLAISIFRVQVVGVSLLLV
jgi:hypothetical protein